MMPSTNPSSGNASSRWRLLYDGVVLDCDRAKLPERIAEARSAIFDRAEEILTRSSIDEHRTLNHALRVLRLLEEAVAREKNAA